MKKFDYLLKYLQFTPLQLALVRSEEVYWMSRIKMARPILDIGCSDGAFSEIMFDGEKGAIDVGIDVDEIFLSLAQKSPVYKKVIKADARNLPFQDQSFATIFSNETLEHVKEVDKVLFEVARVLKKKGRFIILVPTVFLDDYWLTSAPFKALGFNFLSNFFHKLRNSLFEHHNLWPIALWEKKLQKAGFKLESYQYNGTKECYFISEIFWPVRIPQYILARIFKKRFLFPRQPAIWLARLLKNYLENDKNGYLEKGPTMLIIAQKK